MGLVLQAERRVFAVGNFFSRIFAAKTFRSEREITPTWESSWPEKRLQFYQNNYKSPTFALHTIRGQYFQRTAVEPQIKNKVSGH